jgi:RNA polymerase sigma-70 factor (ECF subfamily)
MIDRQRLHEDAYRWDVVATLMHDYGDAIMQYCLTRLGEGLADEITQEVFVTAWQQLPKYRSTAPVRTWLFGIAHHKCQQTYRNWARRQAIAQAFGEEIRGRAHAQAPLTPDDLKTQGEISVQLHASLEKLRTEDRIVLTLWYWKELPLTEVADIMGKSVAAMRKQLSRAQQRLKELLHASLET